MLNEVERCRVGDLEGLVVVWVDEGTQSKLLRNRPSVLVQVVSKEVDSRVVVGSKAVAGAFEAVSEATTVDMAIEEVLGFKIEEDSEDDKVAIKVLLLRVLRAGLEEAEVAMAVLITTKTEEMATAVEVVAEEEAAMAEATVA